MSAPAINLSNYREGDLVIMGETPYGDVEPGTLGTIVNIIGHPETTAAVANVRPVDEPAATYALYASEIAPAPIEKGSRVRVIENPDRAYFIAPPAEERVGEVAGLMPFGQAVIVHFDVSDLNPDKPVLVQAIRVSDLAAVAAPVQASIEDLLDEDNVEGDTKDNDPEAVDAEDLMAILFGVDPEEMVSEAVDVEGRCVFCGEEGPCPSAAFSGNDSQDGSEIRGGDLVRYVGPRMLASGAVGRVYRDRKEGEPFFLIQWSTSAPEMLDNGRFRAEDFERVTGAQPGDTVGVLMPDVDDPLDAVMTVRGTVIAAADIDEGTVAVALQMEDGSEQERVVVPEWTVVFVPREDGSFPDYVVDALGGDLD